MPKQLVLLGLVCTLNLVWGKGFSLDELIAQHSGFNPVASVAGNQKLEPSVLLRRDAVDSSPQQHGLTAKNVLNLAQKIGGVLGNIRSDKAIVYSPVSIAAALQLVLLGANGETYNELLRLLSVDNPGRLHEDFGASIGDLLATSVDDVNGKGEKTNTIVNGAGSLDHHVSIVNGLFVQNGFSIRPDYRSVVESIYRSEITELDFLNHPTDAASFINNWVERSTHGKVKDIVPHTIARDTRVIIASTIYFNAHWKETFIEGATRPRQFFPDGEGGRHILVQMMSFGGTLPFYNSREYNCRILGLPYKNNLSTLYIIIPDNSNPQRVRELQNDLTSDKIDYMISRMTMNTTILLFPKLHLSMDFKLRDVLKQLGVRTLFSPSAADLSLISDEDVLGGVVEKLSDIRAFSPAAGNAASGLPLQNENREDVLIFSRLRAEDDEDSDMSDKDRKRAKRATYKAASKFDRESEPLTLKDFVLRKRITKPLAEQKLRRSRRQTSAFDSLNSLSQLRGRIPTNPGLFASEVIHKVDLTINEKGTEGGASTLVFLHKTGTDVVFRANVPFLFLIRNDATKLPLFYGTVFEPEEHQ
ncbi:serine protease inhibitor 28Dc-like [Lutzomyia longipalpis]|nr:serine protease inhibitor 28Dc-like [Lutzomyia longipalpis]XP_055683577.1 serine protease inhibitor 28Dc-like [Lutzomyia longipalpis]